MAVVRGRLVFLDTLGDENVPIANAPIQLWDLDLVTNDFLAEGRTAEDGFFELTYDPDDAAESWEGRPELMIRLMDREFTWTADGGPKAHYHVVNSFRMREEPKANGDADFGVLRAEFWGYQSAEGPNAIAFTPRVRVLDGRTPQEHRPGRNFEQLRVGSKHLFARERHKLIASFREKHPTPAEIEDDYPVEGSTRAIADAFSDDYICELVLNGFNPCLFEKGEEGELIVDFRWEGLEQDGRHFAPSTRAFFRLEEAEGATKLRLKAIEVQKRVGASASAHAMPRPCRRYGPTDGKKWERVKRLFRCNYFLFGEVHTHLTGTHLNIEQYIMPVRRNLLQSPVAALLLPHLYGTTAVNLAANDILLHAEGLVQLTSALTTNSVQHAARRHLGTLNWKGFTPRKVICDDHSFAKVGQLMWNVLQGYVSAYLKDNVDDIAAYWPEIRRMSNDLVANSVPWVQSNEGLAHDTSEMNRSELPHKGVGGRAVALSAVTEVDTPTAECWAALRQLCTYILYHATFVHTWVNDRQYLMGGEIEFATLGLVDDATNTDIPDEALVPSKEALEHPFVTYVLNYTEYGYVFRNEDDDMNPALLGALSEKRSEFGELGFDIRTLRSCINT